MKKLTMLVVGTFVVMLPLLSIAEACLVEFDANKPKPVGRVCYLNDGGYGAGSWSDTVSVSR